MDILVHRQRETTTNREKGQDPSRKNKRKVERRNSSMDRRRSVIDGIVVNLSMSERERRARFERRHSSTLPIMAIGLPCKTGRSFVDVLV